MVFCSLRETGKIRIREMVVLENDFEFFSMSERMILAFCRVFVLLLSREHRVSVRQKEISTKWSYFLVARANLSSVGLIRALIVFLLFRSFIITRLSLSIWIGKHL